MLENTFTKAGRIGYAVGMLVFGLAHFAKAADFAALVPIAGGVYWVYFTGVCLVAAAVALIAQKQIALASLLLGVMLLGFVLLVHGPAMFSADAAIKANGVAHTFKTLSLAGAAFFFYGLYRESQGSQLS